MSDSSVTASSTPATSHPLLQVARGLASDLLSTLVFAGLYAATHNIYLSAGLGIASSVVQIGIQRLRGQPIDLMQWLSLFLVVVFGGATLLAHDPSFVMLKPTLIYAAVGTVMLKRGWMNRYMTPAAREHSADVNLVFGYVWAGLMFTTAAANLALVWFASPAAWAWFIGAFPIGSKIMLVAIQYLITRGTVRRRIRTSRLVPAAG